MDEKEAQILNVQYRFYDFTDIDLEKCIDDVYDECAAGLISNLIKALKVKGVVDESDRRTLSDEEYMNLIRDPNAAVILGSEYAFEVADYKNREKLNEYLINLDYIFAGFANQLLVLSKKVYIKIKEIKVLIRPGRMEDEYTTKMSNGKYSYEIMNGIPAEFTEEELEEFLYNRRKMIEVNIKVEFIMPEEKTGTILVKI